MSEERYAALLAFVSHARWFGGKGRAAQVVGIERLGSLAEAENPHVVVELVELGYADEPDETELYQVPLALYTDPQARLEHAFVGWWEDPDHGWVHAYDAVHDRDAMAQWLERFLTADAATDQPGPLVFHRLTGHDLDPDVHSTLFSGEQSNSSVMFGDDSLLKLFRRITPGANPDITVHEALTRAGSEHVAELYGWVEVPDGPLHLGMLQQFLRTATDGWDLALASVRNLYAEADLYADEVGGDFAAEAARLGGAVAEVHTTMAQRFGAGTADMRVVADQMEARLRAALDVVPALSSVAPAVRAAYARLAELGEQPVQRIHGDLHLGQTLRTVRGWKIVDFEGEPAKPLAERVLPDSRWRDVAGMLRSFDYAPRVAAMTLDGADDEEAAQRIVRAGEWFVRNRDAFLDAYAGRDLTAEETAQLEAYVADKAVYEAVYEARNRPTWVDVPLAALTRLAGGPPPAATLG